MGIQRPLVEPQGTTASIYQLVDLDTWEVVYVGSTTVLLYDRLMGHLRRPATIQMKELVGSRRLGIEALMEVPIEERHLAEVRAIHDALRRGQPLVNKLTYERALASS